MQFSLQKKCKRVYQVYNSLFVNWVGTSPAFTSINSLGELNTQDAISSVASASVGSSSNISPQNNDIGKGVFNPRVLAKLKYLLL